MSGVIRIGDPVSAGGVVWAADDGNKFIQCREGCSFFALRPQGGRQ